MKYFIWGLGSVGYSFLLKLIDNNLFIPSSFYCVDFNLESKEKFLNRGGLESHFYVDKVTKDNYIQYLNKLEEGDYLLDFSIDIKNLEVVRYCLKHNIHYLFTADSSWNPDPSWISCHQHYLEYLKLKEEFKDNKTTCLIEFGMNPGMVSSFAKKCLAEIVDNDKSIYVRTHREELKKLYIDKQYGLLCKKLKVTDVQEVDNDDQTFAIPYEDNVCYSTWNVYSYYYETISSPELALGKANALFKYNKIYDVDFDDLYISPDKCGFEYESTSYSPQGIFTGHLSTHEEIFSIRRIFTYKKYRPSVHFVYSPCEYATKSITQFKNNEPERLHLLTKDECTSGGESVGIIIQGKRFKTRYFGNYLETNKCSESATILQVSASSYAGFIYMLKHNNEGLLFPEEVDQDEILDNAKKYLKEYISKEIPRIKIFLGKDK